MSIKMIKKTNVVEEVYEQMRENIINGEWSPGDKIPSENTLCELFGVSRNTVRSAIQKLKTLGILESKQGYGTFVSKSINEKLVDNFLPLIYLDNNEIIEILEFRKSIEVEGIAKAAKRADEEDLKNIEEALNQLIKYKDDYKKFSVADYQFHLRIAKASKNKIFYKVMTRLKDILYSHLEEMNKDIGPKVSLDDHKNMFKAIKEGEPKLAKKLLQNMIETSISNVKKN